MHERNLRTELALVEEKIARLERKRDELQAELETITAPVEVKKPKRKTKQLIIPEDN